MKCNIFNISWFSVFRKKIRGDTNFCIYFILFLTAHFSTKAVIWKIFLPAKTSCSNSPEFKRKISILQCFQLNLSRLQLKSIWWSHLAPKASCISICLFVCLQRKLGRSIGYLESKEIVLQILRKPRSIARSLGLSGESLASYSSTLNTGIYFVIQHMCQYIDTVNVKIISLRTEWKWCSCPYSIKKEYYCGSFTIKENVDFLSSLFVLLEEKH